MGHYPFLFVNTTLVVGCMALAVVFLTLPLPKTETLYKYKVSLRFLAGSYITLAVLKILIMCFNLSLLNLLSMERLTIASLQATLFAISLIILINPRFVTKKYLYRQISPVLFLGLLYLLFVAKWGDLNIQSFSDLFRYKFSPVMIVREFFALYYIYQLIYLTWLFARQVKLFDNKINNYFSECSGQCLSWIRYCYIAVLMVGIGAFLSCFLLNDLWFFIFTAIYTLFYLSFGIYYIQYPRKFVYIEPAVFARNKAVDRVVSYRKKLEWPELRSRIIDEKYYLIQGVNIEDMALHLKIGRTTLSTFINNEEGVNFNQWINSLRIEEAKNLLANYPEYSLTQISELVGYSEPSNFSRQFKLFTNESPSIWRHTLSDTPDYKLN
ncbi:MAG: transcriptional regulator, AraC family [Bacteroidetes bacterium]|nr:transcriptional regulator, AraC family [Bacteroidota bacterium]